MSTTTTNQDTRAVIWSCLLGNITAWYDFYIFAAAVALVFSHLFFPEMGYLLPILVFAVGFIMRPLGSIFFGHLGDRFGRKNTMIATLALTGASTLAIGLSPTYADIGIAATVFLFVARLLQSFALGGEWAAGTTLMLEHNIDSKKLGFLGGLLQFGSSVAAMLTAVTWMLVTQLDRQDLLDWGWRIPFMTSFLLFAIGIFIRSRIKESPLFVPQTNKPVKISETPLAKSIKYHWKTIVAGVLAFQLTSAWYFAISVFGIGYLVSQGTPRAEITPIWFYVTWILIAFDAFMAWASDKVSRIKIMQASAILSLVFAYYIFSTLAAGGIWIPLLLGTVLISHMMWPVMATVLTQSFPTEVRQTSSGLVFTFAGLIGGGLVPIWSQAITASSGLTSVAYMFVFLSIVSLIASHYLGKQTGHANT